MEAMRGIESRQRQQHISQSSRREAAAQGPNKARKCGVWGLYPPDLPRTVTTKVQKAPFRKYGEIS